MHSGIEKNMVLTSWHGYHFDMFVNCVLYKPDLNVYIQERLYDILPGMELTPTNPYTLKVQYVKNPSQVMKSLLFLWRMKHL